RSRARVYAGDLRVDRARAGIRIRMVVDIHRIACLCVEVERIAGVQVTDRDRQPLRDAVPEKRDRDAVALALCQFLLHDASVADLEEGGNAASTRPAVRETVRLRRAASGDVRPTARPSR